MADSNLNEDDLDALFAGDDAAPAPLSPVSVEAKQEDAGEDAGEDADEDSGDGSEESEGDASDGADAVSGADSASDDEAEAEAASESDASEDADASEDGVVSFDQLIRTAKKSGPKPVAAHKPEFDSEGEDSGLADILSVAKAMKSKREDAVEASEDEPAKISDDDDDDLLADRGAGFGAAAAVAVVEVAREPTPAKTDEKTKAAAAPAAAAPPAEGGGGGKFAIAAVLIAAIGGVGYMTMGGQDKATKGPGAAEAGRPQVAAIEPKGVSDDKDDENDKDADEPAKLEPKADDSDDIEPSEAEAEGELLAMADEAGDTEGAPALGDGSGDAKKADAKGKKGKKSKKGGGASKADAEGKAEDASADAGAEDKPDGAEEKPEDAGAEGGAEDKPEEGAEDKPAEKAGGGGSEVDCLLNPDKPGCGGKKKVEKKVDDGPALPEKLSQTALRAGFQSVKAQAKECGAKNKIPAGTKVKIKVSIEGASGKVVKAAALGDHANTSVGRCIEANVKTASFGKFSSGQMGITWPFKL